MTVLIADGMGVKDPNLAQVVARLREIFKGIDMATSLRDHFQEIAEMERARRFELPTFTLAIGCPSINKAGEFVGGIKIAVHTKAINVKSLQSSGQMPDIGPAQQNRPSIAPTQAQPDTPIGPAVARPASTAATAAVEPGRFLRRGHNQGH